MTAYTGPVEHKRRHYWTILLFLLLLAGVFCLGGMLLFYGRSVTQETRHIPVHLHSVLEANYSVDPNPPRLPGVRLDLIWDAIFDKEEGAADLEARQAALLTTLQTPVPFVTSPVCQGSHTIYVDRDTWVDSAKPTATHGNDTILKIGRDGDHVKRILLDFALNDNIPQGTFIYSARLEMNVAGGAAISTPPFQFYNLRDPFQASITNWSNQPDTYTTYRPSPLTIPDIHAWDITDIVQAWLLGYYPNNGLVLEPQSSNDFTLFYYSQEASKQTNRNFTPTNQIGPRLIIDCEPPPSPEAIVAATPTVVPNPVNTSPTAPAGSPTSQTTNTPPPRPTVQLSPSPPSASPTAPASTPTTLSSTPTSPPSTPTNSPPTPTSPPPPPTSPPPTPTEIPPDDDDDSPDPAPPPPPPSANLAIGKTGAPNPVTVGNNLTYNLNVINNGPSNATGVTVIDTLPANVTLVSATPSQGTCSGTNTITCNLGSITNGGNATITIVITVDLSATGTLLNSATVSASETDPDTSNNTATAATNVTPGVTLSINDVLITEGGPPGSTSAVFTVTLSMASAQTVTVDYVTADGSATAPADYTTTGNTLSFPPGVTQQTLSVQVIGDTAVESNETFLVNLSNPSNATIADNQGVGTIINDDGVSIIINDVSITEGDPPGSTSAVFTVTLSAASVQTITVDYATADGSATAPADYTATGNTLSFPPGVTQQTLSVQVVRDTAVEGNETFLVNLSNPSNAIIADNQGVGTIINDDGVSITINDVSITEGNAGNVSAVFTVTLSAASAQTVTVDYATADGSATAPADYTATGNTLSFPPGVTQQTLSVQVIGDTTVEPDESFFVNLFNAVNASLTDDQGRGTILNDDSSASIVVTCFNASRDAWLQEDNPTTNWGSHPNLETQPNAGAEHRIVIGFDLSSISPLSTVLTSTLSLYEDDQGPGGQTISVHPVTTNWAEATVTWNAPWATPGGDVDPATTTFTPDVKQGYKNIDVTSVTADWVNGSRPNYGLLLQASGPNGEVVFKSKESAAEKRPQLCVTYQ